MTPRASSADRSVVLLLIEQENDLSHMDSLQPLEGRSYRVTRRSYDDHQREAELRACRECQRSFYFTDPAQVVCLGCQR